MVFQSLPTERHEVQILTTDFQYSGQLETVGPVLNYINDTGRDSLTLYDAHLTPLTPGSPLKGLSRPMVVIRRPQIVFLYFTKAETRAAIKTLTRNEPLVAYTPVAVCKAQFHLAGETRIRDFVDAMQESLLPVSEVRLFPIIELSAPFPTKVDLLLVGRSQIHAYHTT